MERGSTEPSSRSLMELSSQLLGLRDFFNSRKFALMAQESDPNLSGPDHIIAISDVHLAAQSCLPDYHPDYYSILQVPRTASDIRPVASAQFEKLVTLLNPVKSEFPQSWDAFNLVLDAWKVLSDPEKKTMYDIEISNGSTKPSGGKVPESGETGTESGPRVEDHYDKSPFNGERDEEKQKHSVEKENATFWTPCPYCYCMFEYEKLYEDCSLRCQNCKRAFQGLGVPPLPEGALVEGRDEYYCAVGVFPLQLSWDGFSIENKGNAGNNVVEISDDSDDEERINVKKRQIFATGKKVEEAVKREGEGTRGKLNGSEAVDVSTGRPKGRRKKELARRQKRMRHTETESVADGQEGLNVEECRIGSNGSLVCSEDEVEFFEGDDDIFVSLKDAF